MIVRSPHLQKLENVLEGCRQGDLLSQEQLYKQFYGYAMGICLRYANHSAEAVEVLNDGFMKVFTNIQTYDSAQPFRNWLGRIMTNVAIDHYRAQRKHYYHEDITHASQVSTNEGATDSLFYQELIEMVEELTPAYKTVFKLFVIDGYSHDEIANLLGIAVGTSKSNLARAREILREKLKHRDHEY